MGDVHSKGQSHLKGSGRESKWVPSQSNFNWPIASMNRLIQLLALVLIASLLLGDVSSASEVRSNCAQRTVATLFLP